MLLLYCILLTEYGVWRPFEVSTSRTSCDQFLISTCTNHSSLSSNALLQYFIHNRLISFCYPTISVLSSVVTADHKYTEAECANFNIQSTSDILCIYLICM